jgi:hypothetical protein
MRYEDRQAYAPVEVVFLAHAYLTAGDRGNAPEHPEQVDIRALKTWQPGLPAD